MIPLFQLLHVPPLLSMILLHLHISHSSSTRVELDLDSLPPSCADLKFTTFDKFPRSQKVTGGYFCKTCKIFSKEKDGPWISIPISKSNAKKLYSKAQVHASSDSHIRACEGLAVQTAQGSTVSEMIIEHAGKQNQDECFLIGCLICLSYFLFKNEIPHTTNFRSLVSSAIPIDTGKNLLNIIRNAPKNATHLSATIPTAFLECFGQTIRPETARALANVSAYSIMCDEATGANDEQFLSIFVRIFRKSEITEKFLDCIPLSPLKAINLTEIILTSLGNCGMQAGNLVAVSFDGAANFSGENGGVQSLLKQHSKTLRYIHCRSHLLQLALVHASNTRLCIKRVLNLCNRIYAFFAPHPARTRELTASGTLAGIFA